MSIKNGKSMFLSSQIVTLKNRHSSWDYYESLRISNTFLTACKYLIRKKWNLFLTYF